MRGVSCHSMAVMNKLGTAKASHCVLDLIKQKGCDHRTQPRWEWFCYIGPPRIGSWSIPGQQNMFSARFRTNTLFGMANLVEGLELILGNVDREEAGWLLPTCTKLTEVASGEEHSLFFEL